MTTIDLDTIHFEHGNHSSPADGVCVMEAVALLAGEPFGDHPSCVSPVIGAFMRSWNDSLPTVEDRDRLLKPLVLDIMGTNTGVEDDERRAWMATDWLVRVHAPAWLRLAGLNEQADRLASLHELRADTTPAIQPVLDAVRKDAAAAGAAAWAAAGAAAWAAAWAAARTAAWAAARAALQPTVAELQSAAQDLVRAMCAVGVS